MKDLGSRVPEISSLRRLALARPRIGFLIRLHGQRAVGTAFSAAVAGFHFTAQRLPVEDARRRYVAIIAPVFQILARQVGVAPHDPSRVQNTFRVEELFQFLEGGVELGILLGHISGPQEPIPVFSADGSFEAQHQVASSPRRSSPSGPHLHSSSGPGRP